MTKARDVNTPDAEERTPEVRAGKCAGLIRVDSELRDLLEKAGCGDKIENLAGMVAGIHFVLPLPEAKARFERRRKLERAIDAFQRAVEIYERQSGDMLPTPDTVLKRKSHFDDVTDSFVRSLPDLDIAEYLEALQAHLHAEPPEEPGNLDDKAKPDSQGSQDDKDAAPTRRFIAGFGTWVHPLVATPKGSWPTSETAAVATWILRTLDSVGVPRGTHAARIIFRALAERLAAAVQESDSRSGCNSAGDVVKELDRRMKAADGDEGRWAD